MQMSCQCHSKWSMTVWLRPEPLYIQDRPAAFEGDRNMRNVTALIPETSTQVQVTVRKRGLLYPCTLTSTKFDPILKRPICYAEISKIQNATVHILNWVQVQATTHEKAASSPEIGPGKGPRVSLGLNCATGHYSCSITNKITQQNYLDLYWDHNCLTVLLSMLLSI